MAQKKEAPRRLGRGLAALIGDDGDTGDQPEQAEVARQAQRVPIENLRANPYQPRHTFREDDLADLVASVKEKGILQPILVRSVEGSRGQYEIVAGERRWRAAQKAQLHEVPVVVRDLTDAESLEIAIIENVQRADLNAIEEAAGYERLMKQFDYTQETLSKIIGKSRSHVANTLRLLTLPEDVRSYVIDGRLSAGHARTLVGVDGADALAQEMVRKGLNVREAEALVRGRSDENKSGRKSKAAGSPEKDADTRALEQTLSNALGLSVSIKYDEAKGGDVRIGYSTLEQLDEICRRLEGRKRG